MELDAARHRPHPRGRARRGRCGARSADGSSSARPSPGCEPAPRRRGRRWVARQPRTGRRTALSSARQRPARCSPSSPTTSGSRPTTSRSTPACSRACGPPWRSTPTPRRGAPRLQARRRADVRPLGHQERDAATDRLQARDVVPRERVSFTWVPRERNKAADALANESMDAVERGRTGRSGGPGRRLRDGDPGRPGATPCAAPRPAIVGLGTGHRGADRHPRGAPRRHDHSLERRFSGSGGRFDPSWRRRG